MAWRSAEGKNTRATRARVVVQRRLETILAIPFTDSPNGGGILLDVVTQEHHALLLVGSAQQDLGAPSDLPRDLTILQEFLQEDLVLPFQYELVGLTTAHGLSLRFHL